MGAGIRRALAALVVAAFAIVLALAVLVPLYTDEITSWLQLTHALSDGGGQGSLLFPLCHGTFTRPLYATMIPAALAYRALLGGVGLFGLRVSSLIIVGGWFLAVRRATRGRGFASFCALHAFGTFPLALVTARAEPIMLVALGVFAALPLGFRAAARGSWRSRLLLGALFLVTTSIFYASHQRALLYTPLILLSAALTFGWRRKKRLATVIVIAAILCTTVQAYQSARATAACPLAPQTARRLQGVSLEPSAALKEPLLVLKNFASFADITSTMMLLEPQPDHFGWLPHDSASWLPGRAVQLADRMNRGAIIGLLVALPVFVVFALVRARRRPYLRRRAVLAAALVLGAAASVAVANIAAFYNLAGVLPVLALAAVLVAPALDGMPRGIVALGAVVLQLAALASLAALFFSFAPKLIAIERRPTTIYPDRPATVPALGASGERVKIRALAATCGIDGDRARRLVVDDATMFAFDDLREPIHVIYITDAAMWGDDFPGDKDVALLERLQASGLITRCMYLPTKLAPKVRREGDYCCVPKSEIHTP